MTPISHPGCIKYPFVCPNAASASALVENVTVKAFAPGLDGGRLFEDEDDRGAAVVKPVYLPSQPELLVPRSERMRRMQYEGLREVIRTYWPKRAPMMASLHSGGRFVAINFVPAVSSINRTSVVRSCVCFR